MNKSAFLELIQQASAISDQQTEELEKVAATFPYCQTAHLLLAKSAHDKGSMLSTQRLRRASAYAINRQVLKRLIYTSPAPAPVFEEPVATEAEVLALEETNSTPASLSATHEEENKKPSDLQDVIFKKETAEKLEEEVAQEAAVTSTEADADTVAKPALEEEKAEDNAIRGEAETAAETAEQIQDPEEGLYSELAHLLTINSLSPSYTDLLVQKPVVETPENTAASEAPEDSESEEDTTEQEAAEAQQLTNLTAGNTSPSILYTPDAVAAPADEELNISDIELENALSAVPDASPETAPVIYNLGEIDQMYADDALGYWMASSRMGETLQLKDEVTRQRPAAFHPELILEYTKTHVLEEKPREQQTATLHHQYSIIDQFLKLNPRLNTMQHVKMKQEPQEDLSLRNSKIKKGIASESLANIFLNQGKVKKAIKIYEQLLLKYPEKKSYFAEQIEKLQNLS